MPFIPGSRMSISTTSGRSWFTRARATSPEAASPTTCKSECTSRIWRVPSRCNAWSSTTTTRITSASMVTMVNRLRVAPSGGEGAGEVHDAYPAPSPPLGATRSLLTMVTMDADVIRVVVVDDHALHRDGTRQILEVHSDLH